MINMAIRGIGSFTVMSSWMGNDTSVRLMKVPTDMEILQITKVRSLER